MKIFLYVFFNFFGWVSPKAINGGQRSEVIRLTAFIGDSNVKVRPLVLIVTEIPFKIHSVDGWEGGAGGGGGRRGGYKN